MSTALVGTDGAESGSFDAAPAAKARLSSATKPAGSEDAVAARLAAGLLGAVDGAAGTLVRSELGPAAPERALAVEGEFCALRAGNLTTNTIAQPLRATSVWQNNTFGACASCVSAETGHRSGSPCENGGR